MNKFILNISIITLLVFMLALGILYVNEYPIKRCDKNLNLILSDSAKREYIKNWGELLSIKNKDQIKIERSTGTPGHYIVISPEFIWAALESEFINNEIGIIVDDLPHKWPNVNIIGIYLGNSRNGIIYDINLDQKYKELYRIKQTEYNDYYIYCY